MTVDTEHIIRQIPCLRRYARALTRDVERADDLVQDCLERAWRRLDLWQPGSDLRAWLFTIMHNLYVNQVRRYCAQPQLVPIDTVIEPSTGASSAESDAQLRDIEAAIAALPDGQREVLLLVSLEALRYEEVAQILDIPVGTVMSRLHRAREHLRSRLDGSPERGLRSVK
jgi:RNA polymerase sigma-70 factor (ECF subfamily)